MKHVKHPPVSEAPSGTNASLLRENGQEVLDLDRYIPFLICAIGNKWARSSSKIYLEAFGVGVTEWRIMAMLAIEPRITAYRICQVIGLDKAATSRSLRALEGRGLVRSWQEDDSHHRKTLELTEHGMAMHNEIVQVAHQREATLVSDLSAEEVALLGDFLRRLLRRVPEIMKLDERR